MDSLAALLGLILFHEMTAPSLGSSSKAVRKSENTPVLFGVTPASRLNVERSGCINHQEPAPMGPPNHFLWALRSLRNLGQLGEPRRDVKARPLYNHPPGIYGIDATLHAYWPNTLPQARFGCLASKGPCVSSDPEKCNIHLGRLTAYLHRSPVSCTTHQV